MDEKYWLEAAPWLLIVIGLSLSALLLSTKFAIPYGRYYRPLWFPYSVSARTFWAVHELPALLVVVILLFAHWQNGGDAFSRNTLVAILYAGHYFQRSLIYPFKIRNGGPASVEAFASAVLFSLFNGYVQGRKHLAYAMYPKTALYNPTTLLGFSLFIFGMYINIHSDNILTGLRKSEGKRYRIPRGGLFEFVSAANYFGELMEWLGYAIVAQTTAAWAFFFMCICNIAPRALSHHQFYRDNFDDYPASRKALIPLLL